MYCLDYLIATDEDAHFGGTLCKTVANESLSSIKVIPVRSHAIFIGCLEDQLSLSECFTVLIQSSEVFDKGSYSKPNNA